MNLLYLDPKPRKLGHDRVEIFSPAAAHVETTAHDAGTLAIFPERRPVYFGCVPRSDCS